MKKYFIKIIAVFLVMSTVLPFFSGCFKKDPNVKDDGGKTPMDENYYITLDGTESEYVCALDFSSREFILSNPDLKNRITDKYQFSDENFDESKSFFISGKDNGLEIKNSGLRDFSYYDKMIIAVYSEKATYTTMQLRFDNPRREDTKGMAPYYRFPFNVDFTGWKTFTLDLKKMSGNYSPNLNDIEKIVVCTSGWDLTCSPENRIYVGNINLVKENYKIKSEVDLNAKETYEPLKKQWKEYIVGTSQGGKSKEYKSKINYITSECKKNWDKYKKSETFGLEITHKKGDEATIGSYYSNIRAMALGYSTKGCEYFENKELLVDIKKALEYGNKNYYGADRLKKGVYGNWWWWDIGIPLSLMPTLIVIENELKPEEIKRYTELFDAKNKYPSLTACNRIWITKAVFASALLQNDAERIVVSKKMLNEVFDYVNSGDGFYTDGSFIQHGKLAYTGGYGNSMLNELTEIMTIFRGTRFDFTEENVKNQYKWIFDSFVPAMYKGNFFACLRGREVSRHTSERAAHNSTVSSMIKMTTYAPKEIKTRLENIIYYYMTQTGDNYASYVPLMLVDYAVNLSESKREDNSKADREFFKVFPKMDRVAGHFEKYGSCLSLSSTRTYKYESINNENMEGWYQGDGMIYIYTDGYDYDYNYFGYVNPYRMPGTTVSTIKRTVENVFPPTASSDFAGGLGDNKCGFGVYEHGYAKNKHYNSDIKARKSYFMFENEIVCLGSDIQNNDDCDVITVNENRLWRKGDKFSVNGKEVNPEIEKEVKCKAKTMHFTNMGGYIFLDDSEINYRMHKNTNSFLEIWQNHGKNPTGAKYAYVYLPSASSEETEEYNKNPNIRIIENSSDIHAVENISKGTKCYAFYEKGKCRDVEVSERCLVMINEKEIKISNPSQNQVNIKISVKLPEGAEIMGFSENCKGEIVDGVLKLEVNTAENYEFSVKLK